MSSSPTLDAFYAELGRITYKHLPAEQQRALLGAYAALANLPAVPIEVIDDWQETADKAIRKALERGKPLR